MAEELQKRYSGILLHPSSLPSAYGIGDFGKSAYEFIDFLEKAGQTIWQVLPFGPTGFGDSPYQSFSAFAGQPLFISIDELVDEGLLSSKEIGILPDFSKYRIDYGYIQYIKNPLYHKAFENFCEAKKANAVWLSAEFLHSFDEFCEKEKEWLNDYALFMALKDENDGVCFLEWDASMKHPSAKKKAALAKKFAHEMDYYRFLQFLFFRQWAAVKAYANVKGIQIVGDIPIFVSMDSADVWAHPELFQLDSKGYPTVVAGVPPDYFSATGQLWGNPLYDWDAAKKTGYSWWIKRIEGQLSLFDYIRIDHFRGFEAYWAVPYGEETAINGKWVKGPAEDFFFSLQKELGDSLPIWAEDLGIITPEVEKLRDDFNLPGMKVLQFAFSNIDDNDLLPYRFTTSNCICYTGTHDNDTARGWYDSLTPELQDRIRVYMNTDASSIHWDMIRTALSSTAKYAVFPMQDLLGYGSDCRMNTPSVASGNWQFRVQSENFNDGLAAFLKRLTVLFGRCESESKKAEEEQTSAAVKMLDSEKKEV